MLNVNESNALHEFNNNSQFFLNVSRSSSSLFNSFSHSFSCSSLIMQFTHKSYAMKMFQQMIKAKIKAKKSSCNKLKFIKVCFESY